MNRTRHPKFELPLFDDPDDSEAWAVYADWLSEQGDPTGELIALELEVEAATAKGDRPDPSVAARYAKLAHDGPRRWAALALAEPDAALAIEWRRAAPYIARIVAPSAADAIPRIERLLGGSGANDDARFLVELHVGLSLARSDRGQLPASLWSNPARASEPVLPSLQTLNLVAHAALGRREPAIDLQFDWAAALPRLRTLSLRSPGIRCAALRHPELRSLVLSMRGGFDLELTQSLHVAQFSALERLSLWLGRIDESERAEAIRSVDRVIDNLELGPIREFGLNASELPPMSLAHLADSSLARGLERLHLTCGTIGDEHLPALRALIGGARHLRELDLTRNYLSAAAVTELRSSFAGRLYADQQRPEGDRQLPVFGRYGVFDGAPRRT